MTKKKSIWAFVLAFMFILPAMFMLTACGDNKDKTITEISTESGIVANGEFKKGDTLVSSSIDTTSEEGQNAIAKLEYLSYNTKKDVYVYDIHLENNGTHTQPTKEVTITMDAPCESETGFWVFHILSDGLVDRIDTTYADSKISFKTSSFSTFIIAEKAPEWSFKAYVKDDIGGTIHQGSTDEGKLYETSLREDESCILNAIPDDGYEFVGWYQEDDTLISTDAGYTFKMGTSAMTVYAKFGAKVVSLELSANNMTYTIGTTQPDIDAVVVKGVKADGTKVDLVKDTDYTIDNGGLDFTTENTYTITYTFVKDTAIKQTFTIQVVATRYDFNATARNGGKIYLGDVEQTSGYTSKLKENETLTLKAVSDTGYEFTGWYNSEDTLISNDDEYTFTMGTSAMTVYAKFSAKVVSLYLNGTNANLYVIKETVFYLGSTTVLDETKVIVKGVRADETETDVLTKDVDYTIEGSIDTTTEGTYTVTYIYTKDTTVRRTLTIIVTDVKISYDSTSYGSEYGQHLYRTYDGGAVFVSSAAIMVNDVSIRDMKTVLTNTEHEKYAEYSDILSKISYKWFIKGTTTEVQTGSDITMQGTQYRYNMRAVGDEIVGPTTVGEYELVIYYEKNGTQIEKARFEAEITERQFKKITTEEQFVTSSGYGLFESLGYYTIVGEVNGQRYVMQMPKTSDDVASLTTAEVEAKLATGDGFEGITLGNNTDLVFTKYYKLPAMSYSVDGVAKTLYAFGTGHYGTRLERYSSQYAYNLFAQGTIKFNGEKISREFSANEENGILFSFGTDGAVTIYAPNLGTTNNALRLVKNTDGTFAFTCKDSTTDTRESYAVYIYSYYVPVTEQYSYTGKGITKTYDGTAITFNVNDDFTIFNEEISSISDLVKNNMTGTNGGQYRFAYADAMGKGSAEETIELTVAEDGTVTGPTEVGDYLLMFQKQIVEKDGTTYWQTMGYDYCICTINIYSA